MLRSEMQLSTARVRSTELCVGLIYLGEGHLTACGHRCPSLDFILSYNRRLIDEKNNDWRPGGHGGCHDEES